MARATFGGTSSDFTFAVTVNGAIRAQAASLTFWDAETDGSRWNDLLLNGNPASTIVSGNDGQVPTFQGPDNVYEMWADAGGHRVKIISNSIGGATNAATAGFVSGAGATRDAVDARVVASGSGTWGLVPAVADKIVYVSSRGSDSNDGATWKTALLTVQAAVTKLGGPGIIELGQGAISTASTISLASTAGITIRGRQGTTSGATPATSLTFTGTGSGSFIDAKSSTGFTLENVMVLYSSSSFSGRLIDLRDAGAANTTFATIRDCYLGGASAIRTADSLVDVSNTHSLRFERVQFRGANYGLRGKNSSSDTCNAINIHDCYFNDNTTAHILNPGLGWTITGCTWEALHSGAAGAVVCESGVACASLTVIGGWAGDVIAAAGGIQFDITGNNVTIIGTLIGGNTGSTGVKFRNLPGPAAPGGLNVAARFDGTATGIDWTGVAPIGYDFASSTFASNVTTRMTGATGFYTGIDVGEDVPVFQIRNRSTTSGRVAMRFQGDRTGSYTYDLGIDLEGANAKRFGLRDQTRSGTPYDWYVTALGSVVLGSGAAALATTATDGFTYLPTCAGTPTGVATSETGMAPMIVDTTGSKLWVRVGGTWKSTTLA